MNFNDVINDLDSILEKRASEGTGVKEIPEGKTVVNGAKGEVGNSKPVDEKAKKSEVPLDKAEKYLYVDNKENQYPEKKAEFLLAKLTAGIDGLLEKEASPAEQDLERLLLAKQAERQTGAAVAQELLHNMGLTKAADDVIQMVQPALAAEVKAGNISQQVRDSIVEKISGSTDVTDTNVQTVTGAPSNVTSALKEALSPNTVSENKGSEVVPSQPKFEKAPAAEPGVDQGSLEAQAAAIVVRKADLYDQLIKAAESNDPSELVLAKANVVDFLNELS